MCLLSQSYVLPSFSPYIYSGISSQFRTCTNILVGGERKKEREKLSFYVYCLVNGRIGNNNDLMVESVVIGESRRD